MPRSIEADELRRSWAAAVMDAEYEREVQSTAAGRASAALRHRAVALAARGLAEEAHALLLEAARLHPDEDTGAAVASARHDLGHSFTSRSRGVRLENLLEAERYFRAALASPSRANHPRRAVQTQSALALCVRDLAAESADRGQRDRYRAEAVALLRAASTTAEALGPSGWTLAAGFFVNLGNLLVRDRDELDAALTAYGRALELHQRASEHGLGDEAPHERDLAMIAMARGYLRRGRKGDAAKAVELAEQVVRAGDPRTTDRARIAAAEAWLATNDRRSADHAVAHLDAIDLAALPPDRVPFVAELLEKLGKRAKAIELLEWAIEHAVRERAGTKADHAADEAVLRAQHAASAVARLYAAKGDAVAAFLALENCSGLRFTEYTSVFTWRPADPVVRELLGRLRGRQVTAVLFDQAASLLARLPRNEWRDALTQIAARADEVAPIDPDHGAAFRHIGGLADEPDPAARLRRDAEAVMPEIVRIKALLRPHEPTTSAALGTIADVLDRRGLAALLDELPGDVLLRINLARDLLVAAVWRDDGKLVGRTHRVDVARQTWRLLQTAHAPPPSATADELRTLLERLDLSPALPKGRRARAIVLPSSGAAFLPLAALGPPGERLLDRFDAVLWLPSLFPLRTRQDAHPPRARTLLVTPPMTAFRKTAIGDLGADEDWLDLVAATRDRVLARVADADVICFYTHGQRRPFDGGSIDVADGVIGQADVTDRWQGLERVELWACETGVDLPSDPMTPFGVDEPFGLDFEFLRNGVRSAIGTLWPVQMIVTASIVRHYRRDVADGIDAARALAEAQRWWLRDGLPELLRLLASRPEREAMTSFVATLGEATDIGAAMTTLGPTGEPGAPMAPADLERWRAHLTCPISWGGFRFVGIPDRRPLQAWTDEHARPISDDVREEVRRRIEEEPAPREDLGDRLERELQALAQATTDTPTSAQAIAAARRFRERIASSHAHNLLAGLAWLHEALAAGPSKAPARRALVIEAAHLWLDLAGGEAMHPIVSGPAEGARRRARALLTTVTAGNDVGVAQARLAYLDAVLGGASFDDAARRAWNVIGADMGRPEPTYAAMRRATVVCDWFAFAPKAVASAPERVLAHVDTLLELLPDQPADIEDAGAAARMIEARNALVDKLGRPRDRIDLHGALTPRELVRATRREVRRLGELGPPGAPLQLERISSSLGQIEGALWGWPSDRKPLVSASGTPGRAYRELLGQYLRGKAATNQAPHVIACLQYACDLRLGLLHNTMRAAAGISDQPELAPLVDALDGNLAHLLRHRGMLWTSIVDAVDLFELGPPAPTVLDAFAAPAQTLLTAGLSALDLTTWILGTLCNAGPAEAHTARTAAYQAVRMATNLTRAAATTWHGLATAEHKFARDHDLEDHDDPEARKHVGVTARLDPGIVLEANQARLRDLPAGRAVLALALDDQRRMLGACVWRDGRGHGQRLVHIDDARALHALSELLRRNEDDPTPRQGRCAARRDAWTRLDQALAPHLGTLCGDALTEPLHWSVLAPGGLRPLPLLGLHAGDRRIAEHVASLVHLPSLGFGKPRRRATRAAAAACLLARDHDAGDTSFGEAAIATLRHAFPCTVLDPRALRGRDIVEVDDLESRADGLRSLRVYGVGSPFSMNATTSALQLEGRRGLAAYNLADLRFGTCDHVELWACVTGGGEERLLTCDDDDRLPGLVAGFLATGARGVLDLAWPIPDLVKALVCELFGIARRRTPWPPSAFATALAAAAALLGEWVRNARSASSVTHALAVLDTGRRATAALHGVDPALVVPFAPLAGAPSLEGLTVTALLDEMSHPSHLAAFRWWGAAEP